MDANTYQEQAETEDAPECICKVEIASLARFWGPNWAIDHVRKGACSRCGGDLHDGDERVMCPTCGWWVVVDAEGSTFEGNYYTGEGRVTHDVVAEREAALFGYELRIG